MALFDHITLQTLLYASANNAFLEGVKQIMPVTVPAPVVNIQGIENLERSFAFREQAVFLAGGTLTAVQYAGPVVLTSYTAPDGREIRGSLAPTGTLVLVPTKTFLGFTEEYWKNRMAAGANVC